MDDLKGRLESLLFASARTMSSEQLSKLTKEKDVDVVRSTLRQIAADLAGKNSSLMLVEENDHWKFAVQEKYLPYVRKVVTKTELPKTILETLAVVAYKAPVMQSAVIKIRTNKGYSHLDELEKMGYITREKKGRTKLIKLTQKFFDYFDVPPEKLKEKFRKVEVVDVVERVDDKLPSPVELVQEKVGDLEVFKTTPLPGEEKPMIGDLEVYEVPPGEEHEHRRFHRSAKEESVQEKPAGTAETSTEGATEQAVPLPAPTLEETISKKVSELKPEEFTSEVKQLITAVRKEKVEGVFPGGVPEDVAKAASARVEEMLKPKAKKEESEELDEEFHQ